MRNWIAGGCCVVVLGVVAAAAAQPPRPVNPSKLTNLKIGLLKSGDRVATRLAGTKQYQLYAKCAAVTRAAHIFQNATTQIPLMQCR